MLGTIRLSVSSSYLLLLLFPLPLELRSMSLNDADALFRQTMLSHVVYRHVRKLRKSSLRQPLTKPKVRSRLGRLLLLPLRFGCLWLLGLSSHRRIL
jgi:hypothetical protein